MYKLHMEGNTRSRLSKQPVGSYRTEIRYFDRILDIQLCRAHMALEKKAGLKGIMAPCYDVTESQLI